MDEPWTPLKVLEWTTGRFGDAGIEPARLEAQILLAHALGMSRVELYTHFDKPLARDELGRARALIKRRLGGEPIAYLTGEQEFWSLAFAVDPRVLIPRRDTETLVEVALAAIADRDAKVTVLDVATGAGPLAVALARELPAARVVATDVSEDALAVARANVARHGLGERIELRHGDLLAALGADERFDVVVANPPYVAAADLPGLAADVQVEPRLALDGGADGLDVIRRLLAAAPDHLCAGGLVAIEHGFDQGARVRALVSADARWRAPTTKADLAGRERVTSARRA